MNAFSNHPMSRRTFNLLAVGVPVAALVGRPQSLLAQEGTPSASPVPTGVLTSERPYLLSGEAVPITITPLLTAGDTVGDFQMAGNPSGIGGFSEGPEIELIVTHDLTTDDGANLSDSRVSHIVVDKTTGTIVRAEYLLDGSEGYKSFRTASKTSEKVGFSFPLTLTGEGTTTGPHGGIAVAFSGLDWALTELPWMGFMMHTGFTVVPGFPNHKVVALTDGDPDGSKLYLYAADSAEGLLQGGGTLHVFVADEASTAADIGKGDTLSGTFVPVGETDNADAATLSAAASAAGAFQFENLQTVIWDRNDATQTIIYFADAGKKDGVSPNGRVYSLKIDPADPTVATDFKVLLDGDADEDIRNPVSLTNNKTQLMIGEGLKGYNRGGEPGRIQVYDLLAGTMGTFGVVDETGGSGQETGSWEASGLLNAGDFYGHGSMLGTVKAPSPPTPQFGQEDVGGQLLLTKLA